MAAPATMGKYCTKLADMEIGDYIKCVYEAPYSNDAGYFSQLGTKDPYYIKTTTTTTDGVKGDPVVEKVKYAELPTTPLVNNISGYFYLLKADYGMLIADRMVQQQISWETLNKKNYIYGGAFDAVNARTTQTVDITITHKTFESTDTASDATTTDNQFDSADRYVETKRTQVVVGNAYVAATDTAAEVPAKPTTTTITITRTNYAFLDYTPKDTITAVDPSDPISVDFGKTADDVAELLAGVTTAKATILSKDEKTTYTKDINITWDTVAFKVNTIGRQTIYGTLEDLSADADNPIVNPEGIKASVIVTTKADQITSVAAVSPITVKYGTTQTTMATTLESIPMVDITITKDDGSTYVKNGVTVVWDTAKYTTRKVGQQTIYGVLEDLSDQGIANDNDVKAEVVVNTSKIGTIDSFVVKTATAENGASNIADLLGADVVANVTTDYYNPDENVSTIDLHVTWDTSSIDTSIPGDQTVNGTVTDDTSDYSIGAIRPTATVTIKPRIDSYESGLAFTVENGTSANDVAKQLKTTVKANTTEASGTGSIDLAVTWDTTGYDPNKPGVQTINGTIATDISAYTNKAGIMSYAVTVKPSIDSYITPTLTVTKGTSADDVAKQLATNVTANTTTSTGTSTISVAVTWDTSSFNSNDTGVQMLSGTITDDISAFTNKAGNPEYKITVTEPAS